MGIALLKLSLVMQEWIHNLLQSEGSEVDFDVKRSISEPTDKPVMRHGATSTVTLTGDWLTTRSYILWRVHYELLGAPDGKDGWNKAVAKFSLLKQRNLQRVVLYHKINLPLLL